MKTNFLKIIFSVILLLLFVNVADAQCSMCRAVLESDTDQSAAKGINNGIVYLMAFPYLLVGGVFYAVYRSRRQKKQEAE
ncbi:MAG: hypothetical protein ACTIKA_00780 [Psychroflexus halocasei]|uniref:hypothetical protein n=1 Tax=Psychroflexus sp. S27 TaxID=1982757 RepID=UPI000C2AD994|nr:hypothetical protein [Psychroflexus sp. S27]PJX22909.1 hypothetical protein CAP47_06495 [Psychroflexus sp. S27]